MARSVLAAVLACLACLACLALLAASTALAQESPRKYPLAIPKQQLALALRELSSQTGIYYGYSPETTAEEQMLVGPLNGSYTIDEALTELLRSTGLTFSRINSTNIAIVKAPPAPKVAPPPPKPPRAAMRVTPAPSREEPAADRIIDEVFIEASRLRHLPAPSAAGFVLDRREIEHTGAPTIMDLLKFLPQQPFLRPDGFRSNGAQYAELRGLGPDTTLVLINGHRAFASAASFAVNAFDLNQLPLSAVERVEVQLDSISVRHGADAIGGIINVVLRDDIPDPSIAVRYGSATGGGEERQAAISTGFAGEDARAAVIVDFRDVAPLFGAERDLWRNQDYRRFGGSDLRSPLSSPGNVSVTTLEGLGALGAPSAAIPEHTAGPITQPDEFLPFQLNRESLLQYFPIVTEDRRASIVASAQANITPDLVAAADLMVVDRRVAFSSTPMLIPGAIVPGTNPYNSLHQPVTVTALLDGTPPTRATTDSLLIRGAGSLRGKIGNGDWELSLLRSEEDARQRVDNSVDPERLALVLADPDPERTLNLLGLGPAGSPDVLASVAPPVIDTFATDATQLTGVVNGELFALPAGDVSTVLGTEWRKEAVQFDSLLGSYDRKVAGGFAELHVPLLGGRMQLLAARELTVTIAGRFDRYTDFGEIFTPQYGLVWRPLQLVEIRGTYGRSFRAPSLYELYLPRVPSLPVAISDPRRNGETNPVTLLGGGNRELEATRGESFTAGIEFTPEAIEPLALSATYWHVTMDDRVIVLPASFALMHESDVADRVLRAEPTTADLAAGLPGRVLQIDVTRMNFGRLTTSGVDVGASYAFDTVAGHFSADVKSTWIGEYEALDLPGVPPTDRVNVADTFGTVAKWRAVASLGWERGALGATTYLRYIPSYNDTRNGARNGRTVPSQTFLDLQFSVDVGKLADRTGLLRGVEFTAGALNALDQEPPFAEVRGVEGYDTSQGDLKGRFWYLRLGKTF